MKKKLLSVLLVSAMSASLLAGCGGKGDGTESGVTSSDPNTLTVFAWDANFNIPALRAAEEDYRANYNKDFKLEIIEQSNSKDVENAITLAGSSGKYTNLADIVLFQDHYIQQYVRNYPDAWVSVDDADVDWTNFGEEKLSYSTINGEHYGFPVDNGTVIFAYRVDLLEECGYTLDDVTGITWDEFIEIGKAVKEKTGKYLLSMDGDGNDLFYMMLQAEGASQFKDGKAYITENKTLVDIVDVMHRMSEAGVLYLANDWTAYTDESIKGDMVAGVMNGNWIIPTIEQVAENSGKWEITTMPTLTGKEGYASNGGSSLYITSNCKKTDLAKDFLAKTFGGSTTTYDKALTDGGVITCCISAGTSDVYNQGVAYFNDQPIYSKIVEMGSHVQVIEQSDYHYDARTYLAAAMVNINNGSDIESELATAEENLKFAMEK